MQQGVLARLPRVPAGRDAPAPLRGCGDGASLLPAVPPRAARVARCRGMSLNPQYPFGLPVWEGNVPAAPDFGHPDPAHGHSAASAPPDQTPKDKHPAQGTI